MKFDLSFWRFAIFIHLSKTWTWGRDVNTKKEEVYYFHVGTISKDGQIALKIIILPINFMIGFARRKK